MVYAGSGDPERTLALLWGREPPATRGPRARSSKEEIVAAAVDVADREGLAGLSMRKLAERLDLTPMALYPHVGAKADLLDLMLDRAIGELVDQDGTVDAGWRQRLARSAERAWEMYLRHPWVLEVAGGRSPLGPAEFAYFEQQLGLLDELGLTDEAAMQVIGAVGSYVRGSARAASELQGAADATGVSDADYWRLRAAALGRIMDDTTRRQFPRLAAAGMLDAFLGTAEVSMDPEAPMAAATASFTFGLGLLLDGIEALVAAADAATP